MSELKELYQQIAEIGRRLGARRIVLYGSRARGDHRERSDIDLAVFGAPPKSYSAFLDSLDELPTLLRFDLVFVTDQTSRDLLKNIEQDGITLMSKLKEKYDKLAKAVSRLQESIADFERYHMDSIRDGVIQRFEFCAELAWKTLREYLIDQGYQNVNSPKAVMRLSYEDGIINNDASWVSLMNARNLTSHTYDEDTADEIYHLICQSYVVILNELVQDLSQYC